MGGLARKDPAAGTGLKEKKGRGGQFLGWREGQFRCWGNNKPGTSGTPERDCRLKERGEDDKKEGNEESRQTLENGIPVF